MKFKCIENGKRRLCECGKKLYKIRLQIHGFREEGDKIQFYCKKCFKEYNSTYGIDVK